MKDGEQHDELAAQQRLLAEVFPQAALTPEYLDWLYRRSPDGVNIASDYSEAGKLLGHYTIIPQRWRIGAETRLLALSLNTAVHTDARGKGLFVRLAEETYAQAPDRQVQAIIGVANANSTPGFTRRLGFTLLAPLPVVAGLALPLRPVQAEGHTVDDAFLRGKRFSEIAAGLQAGHPRGIVQDWPIDKLRWRLSSPRHRYALHAHPTGALVTTQVVARGVRIVVALKFLASEGVPLVDTKALLRAATTHHRSPFFVYSGFNEKASLEGLALPRRLLPSPLNLIYRKLDSGMPDARDVRFGAFEFLDFDAY